MSFVRIDSTKPISGIRITRDEAPPSNDPAIYLIGFGERLSSDEVPRSNRKVIIMLSKMSTSM